MTRVLGHRGWRGLYPENSLIGFEKLSLAGIDAVELDIVITKDKEILVSHEPWFDLQYCKAKSPSNIYQSTLSAIQKIDCGSKIDTRFPNQLKVASVKPKFSSLIELWNSLGVKPFLALEVKSESKLYGSCQPFALEFAEILLSFEKQYLSDFEYFIQSFDPFFLKTYHSINPKKETGLLLENRVDLYHSLDFLQYKPTFINPEHVLLTDNLMYTLQSENLKTHTWTVNTWEDYLRIKDYPLEGIISDYPELFFKKI